MGKCKKCNNEDYISEWGATWCISCGNMIESDVTYVRSYNNPISTRTYPAYSRQKRFYNYLMGLKDCRICEEVDEILNYFNLIEFHWNIFNTTNRKYFFNRYVVLYYIIQKLNLKIPVRTLKDTSRVDVQIADLENLLNRIPKIISPE